MKPYLIFKLHDLKYGIDPTVVKEIFLLPELMPIAESPADILGILNLRGKITPVMHLNLRLGNSLAECHLNDNIIVFQLDNIQIGMIVHTVQEVMNIDSKLIQTQVDYQGLRTSGSGFSKVHPAFISGIAKVDEEMIVLLNPEALIRQPDAVEDLLNTESHLDIESDKPEEAKQIKFISNFYELCCPDATPEERDVFQQRAETLAKAQIEEKVETSEQIPLAVVNLDGEYFGINLATVREFTKVSSFTPIPCCPQHIIGNMNLRGEILTLVDIRQNLNLEVSPVEPGSQAVVVEVDNIVAGLPVDEVLDVMYVNAEEVDSVPIAISADSEYFQGSTTFSEQIITIIDLPKLMTNKQLVVNEAV